MQPKKLFPRIERDGKGLMEQTESKYSLLASMEDFEGDT